MLDLNGELLKYDLTEEEYESLLEDCEKKVARESDLDWQEIAEKYNLDWNGDTLRKGCVTLVGGTFVKQYYEEKYSKQSFSDDEYLNKLDEKKRELERARTKLNSDKVEYNRWLREDCRNEMIVEKICNAITSLPALNAPQPLEARESQKEYLLCFGDQHYGTEFEIKDLFGNIINSYNVDIFEKRMEELLAQTIDLVKKENISVLNIFSMGDELDGILRISQLMKLRYGVVEATIKFSEYMSQWLNELSRYVKIIYYQTSGNHTELRMLNQKKGTFVEDNMSKVILEFIKERLKDNPNIQIKENPTGYMFAQLCGYTILGFHGETKNMEQQLKNFQHIYEMPINYLIAGHLHHSKSESVGFNSEVINIPSIIGIDDYSMSLNKVSNAGATLLVFERLKGKVCEYSIKFIN